MTYCAYAVVYPDHVLWLSSRFIFIKKNSRLCCFIVFSPMLFDCLFAYDVWLFSRICCVTSLYAELEQSPQLVGGTLKRTNLTSGRSLISSQQTTNTQKKRRRMGEINKDNTKIGGILNRRFWQLGQGWFPLTLKTREQKKKDKNCEQGQYKKRITNGKFNS